MKVVIIVLALLSFLPLMESSISCVNGEIKLVGGATDREGNLEVCCSDKWHIVCANMYTLSTANAYVMCGDLGFSEQGSFKYNTGSISLMNVNGSESSLWNCSNETISNCNSTIQLQCKPAQCRDGQLRLVEGETEWEGRLEVCLSQRWGTVNNDGWMTTNTQVVCKDLGYEHSADQEIIIVTSETAVFLPVHLSHIVCSGSELDLLECSYKNNAEENSHSNDTSVKCRKANCSDGDVRLSGEDTQFMYKGRVEVCINRTWGTVNSHGWTEEDTQVVCRQLECPTEVENSSFYLNTNRGIANSLPIHLDNVGCYGNEEMLLNCSHNMDTGEDTHSQDVWVLCSCLKNESESTEDTSINRETEETSNNKESDSSSATIIAAFSLTISIVCAIALVAAFIVIVVLLLQMKKMLTSRNITKSSLTSNAVEKQETEQQAVLVRKRSSQRLTVTSETKHYRRKTRSCSVESEKKHGSFNRSMSTGTPHNEDSNYSLLKQNTAGDATADISLEEGHNNYFKLAHIPTDDMPKNPAKHDESSYSKLDHNFARKDTSIGSSEQETYPNPEYPGPTKWSVPIDIPQQEHSTYYNLKPEHNPTSQSTPKPVPSPRTYSNARCNPSTYNGAKKVVSYQKNMPENNYFQIELNPTHFDLPKEEFLYKAT